MPKSFKLVDTENMTYTFTQLGNRYELKDTQGEILLSGIDTEDDFIFDQDLCEVFNYHMLDAMKIFLELIGKCDPWMFETYELYEKVKI